MVYNAYPRSWKDTNADGFGDLAGIIEKLEHLAWLGVDGLWLNPTMPSPDHDWGYDIADYRGVHPDFGDHEDLQRLIEIAERLGVRVLMDLVPSHTSDEHRWFAASRSATTSPFRDYYVWRPPAPDGGAPNNWLSHFGGPAWTLDPATGEYYLHSFSPHQPKLNWWNPAVRAEFDEILRFWFDRGVAGVRIDALQTLFHDPEFRDDPPATEQDGTTERALGRRFAHSGGHPRVHEAIRHWRALGEEYRSARLLFGETWVPSVDALAAYYGNGSDELHLAWNVPFLQARFTAPALHEVIGRTLDRLPADAWPVWAMSTHDGDGRAATRWCRGEPAAVRCALLLLLTLRGTPVLYYGDEIGMVEPGAELLTHSVRDLAEPHGHRDAGRTPMQWDGGPDGGFSTSARPWLPIAGGPGLNVADQREDPMSTLNLCRDLIALRRTLPDLATGPMTLLPLRGDILTWHRGTLTVALNLGNAPASLPATGTIRVSTAGPRAGEPVPSAVRMEPYEGLVIEEDPDRPL